MKTTFVVGSGRCGSTLLSRMLRTHPDVLSLSEFFSGIAARDGRGQMFFAGDMDGAELWRRLTAPHRVVAAMIGSGEFPELNIPFVLERFAGCSEIPRLAFILPLITDNPGELYDHLEAEVQRWPRRSMIEQYRVLFSHLADVLCKQAVVECSGYSLQFLHRLVEFPEARFIHLHRNGPDCALSMSRHVTFRARMIGKEAKVAARERLTLGASPDSVRREFDGIITPPYDMEKIMSYPIPLVKFGVQWSNVLQHGASQLDGLPLSEWRQICFEDLVRDPRPALDTVAKFLGVTARPAWLEIASKMVNAGEIASRADSLDPGEFESLASACEPGAQAIAVLANKRRMAGWSA